jgi:DNA-binding XRE family transcriptional regulator
MSRPTKYNPDEHPKLARELTGMGRTQADMAEAFDVARSTIELWMKEHPEFSVAIKLGKEDACDRVERALVERATGYTYKGKKPMVVSQGPGAGSVIEYADVETHVVPDVAAQSFFLRNKRAAEWKDRQQIEHVGLDGLAERLAESRKNVLAAQVVPPPETAP